MRIIPTRKFSKGILSDFLPRLSGARGAPRVRRDQSGQGILEYLLVVLVVVGVVFAGAKPVINRLKGQFEKSLKGGIFKDDPTGQQFYYFPITKKK